MSEPSNGEKVDAIAATIQDLVDAVTFLPAKEMSATAHTDRDRLKSILLRASVEAGNLAASIRNET